MRPAPRRPGNSSTWSVMRAPAESTSQTTGSPWRSASSVRRTIFSTVRAPHEPAFTVGSLAMTQTGRPSISPRPVTTPSAGRSSAGASALASRPSSTNEPGSSSRSSRSRTNSLPCRASLSACLWRLPWRARSLAGPMASFVMPRRSRGLGPGRVLEAEELDGGFAHLVLLDLAGDRHRELLGHLHVARHLEVRDPALAERPHHLRGQLGAVARLDPRHDL